MIGYTPAEQAIRAQHGETYATGKDQDTDTRDDAQEEAVAA